MAEQVLISICVPAYKRADFLTRLLDSIAGQRFRDFEVIITDDSPDTKIGELAARYTGSFPLDYVRNPSPEGTPANWNAAIRRARGQWIKLMHDDDWFSSPDSLGAFAEAIRARPDCGFFFSAYQNVDLQKGTIRPVFLNGYRRRALARDASTLFSRNVIGPPSVTLYRAQPEMVYDPALKWVVDIEFYNRLLAGRTFGYIPKILISVGISGEQVTVDCFRQRPIEIPENFYMLNRIGVNKLRNILTYDAWWRLMRNLEITREAEIHEAGYTSAIHPVILSMIHWQSRLPAFVLRTGWLSKPFMFLNYLVNLPKLPA